MDEKETLNKLQQTTELIQKYYDLERCEPYAEQIKLLFAGFMMAAGMSVVGGGSIDWQRLALESARALFGFGFEMGREDAKLDTWREGLEDEDVQS